jgi:hypothetical protein
MNNLPGWALGALPPSVLIFCYGIWVGVSWLRNGKKDTRVPRCPALAIFDKTEKALEHSNEVLIKYTEANKGLIEAVRRNTEQSERLTEELMRMRLRGER